MIELAVLLDKEEANRRALDEEMTRRGRFQYLEQIDKKTHRHWSAGCTLARDGVEPRRAEARKPRAMKGECWRCTEVGHMDS